MKKSLIAVFATVLATAVFAEDYVLTFSTLGPDKYADGATVLDGEKYALVWTPEGAEFAGFNLDGSAVAPSKVVIAAPVAKGGKCPKVLFAVTEEKLAEFKDGTWGVYLLDTRVYPVNANGEITGDPSVGGTCKGYGKAADANGAGFGSAASSAPVSAGTIITPELKIKNIAFDGDNVLITVQGAAGKFQLSAGDAPNALAEGAVRASEEDEMIIVRPKKSGGEFFQVNRK